MPPPPPPLSLFLEALVIILGKLITHPVWFQNSVFFFFFGHDSGLFFCIHYTANTHTPMLMLYLRQGLPLSLL